MFKNAIPFRITGPINSSILQDNLVDHQSREPSALESVTQGFIAPDKDRPDELARKIGDAIFIRLKTIEKILPPAVINEHTDKAVAELGEAEVRKVGRKERSEIKDQTIIKLLPQAFTRSRHTDAFIDNNKGLIVINAASTNKAEDMLSMLRKALGSLPARPINTDRNPSEVMTQWTSTPQESDPFKQGGKYALVSIETKAKKARFSEFESNEITELLDNGANVVSMSLENSDLAFVLDEDLRLKSIHDIRQDQMEYEENESHYEADCIIAHGLITKLVDELVAAFGGEKE